MKDKRLTEGGHGSVHYPYNTYKKGMDRLAARSKDWLTHLFISAGSRYRTLVGIDLELRDFLRPDTKQVLRGCSPHLRGEDHHIRYMFI